MSHIHYKLHRYDAPFLFYEIYNEIYNPSFNPSSEVFCNFTPNLWNSLLPRSRSIRSYYRFIDVLLTYTEIRNYNYCNTCYTRYSRIYFRPISVVKVVCVFI